VVAPIYTSRATTPSLDSGIWELSKLDSSSQLQKLSIPKVPRSQRDSERRAFLQSIPKFQNIARKTRDKATEYSDKMCNYWSVEYLCGHRKFLAGSNCYRLFDQLQRINDPSERSQHMLPFDIPPECLPSRGNIQNGYLNQYCCVECMNNGRYAATRYGAREARYGPGSDRIGVGWRH